MRDIKRIVFTSATPKGNITEWVVLGENYLDFGLCEKIKQIAPNSFQCHFNNNNKHGYFTIHDVIRYYEIEER